MRAYRQFCIPSCRKVNNTYTECKKKRIKGYRKETLHGLRRHNAPRGQFGSHLVSAIGGRPMTIFGVALLALCTLIGVYLGDLLGVALGVKANVGGGGLALLLLIAARVWMVRHGKLSHGVTLGIEFWSTMYIPIVVAMAAQQNVVAAARGGPIGIIAATGSLLLGLAC